MSELRERHTPRNDRRYDVVIWGASSYVGKTISEYYAKNVPFTQAKWTIAGRDKQKLEKLKQELVNLNPSCSDLQILIGDSSDRSSLDKITEQAKVILTTVGPYLKYGFPLIDSCIANGTDYCDLTGESPFIRRIIDKYHKIAQEKEIAIVHCCGFDSIPSDLGTLFVVSHMKRVLNSDTRSVKSFVVDVKGGVSGGTLASAINIMEEKNSFKSMSDPYYLADLSNNTHVKRIGGQGGAKFIGTDKDINRYTAPWLMASINEAVVRRSATLSPELGYSASGFRYAESFGFKSLFQAILTTFGLYTFGLLILFPPTRWIMKRVLPQPGQGPSRQQVERGRWKLIAIGESVTSGNEPPKKVFATIAGHKDPGYGDTCSMIAESALCLAKQKNDLLKKGGVLTPATSMGHLLIDRLQKNANIQFTIDRSLSPGSKSKDN